MMCVIEIRTTSFGSQSVDHDMAASLAHVLVAAAVAKAPLPTETSAMTADGSAVDVRDSP